MKAQLLSEKYSDELFGTLNCYDRVIISGNVQLWCYEKGMTKYFYIHNIRIFDYSEFVLPHRDAIRANAETIAEEHGLEISMCQ